MVIAISYAYGIVYLRCMGTPIEYDRIDVETV